MKPILLADALPFFRRHRLELLQAVLIIAAALWAFAPAFHGDWLWDDYEIREDLTLHSGPGLGKIWFAPATPDYYPLEATFLWLQWHLWHENLFWYHLTNVGLHLLGAFLVWHLLKRLGVRLAWLGGLLFAVHPLVVESVAWVAELKNTLSLPPLLLAMDAFIDYSDSADAGAANARRHLIRSALWFLAAMLCKSSVVMFPVILLLYAWWRRGRIGCADLRAAAPFLAISLALGIVAIRFQIHRAVGNWRLPQESFVVRIADAGLAIGFYFSKCVFPHRLLPIYPPWSIHLWSPLPFIPLLLLGALAVFLWTRRASWGRHALFGLGWFLINLLPILGFIPMAYQHIAPVADHLAYLPLVGVVGLATAGFGRAFTWRNGTGRAASPWLLRGCLSMTAAGTLGGLALASHRYSGVFLDQVTEWTYNLKYNSRSPVLYLNMAFAQNQAGRVADAITSYEQAIRLDPGNAETENGVGDFLVTSEKIPQAIPHYERALEIDPTLLGTRRKLGIALYKTGRAADAVEQYRLALAKKPDDSEMEANLGKALGDLDRQSESIAHLKRALEIDANNAEAENSLGLALAGSGRTEEGITHLQKALRLDPDFAEAHNNLGVALVGASRPNEAIFQFEQALRLKPDFGQAHNNLGFSLAATGRRKEAIANFEEALRIEPADPKAQYNLAVLLEMDNRIHDAIAHLREAVRLKPDFDDARSSLYRLQAVETLGGPLPPPDSPQQGKGRK